MWFCIYSQENISLSNAFASLGADAQGYFANLTYTLGATSSGTDEDLVDRYDYIVTKKSKRELDVSSLPVHDPAK